MNRNKSVKLVSIVVMLIVFIGAIYLHKPIVYKDKYITIASNREGLLSVEYTGNKEYAVIVVYKDTYKNQYIVSNTEKLNIGLTYGSGNYTIKIGEYEGQKKVSIYKEVSYTLKDYDQQSVFTKGEYYIDKDVRQYLEDKIADTIEDSYAYSSSLVYNTELEHDIRQNKYDFYTPDLKKVIESNTGICIDKASMLASLLRPQGIPCKIVVGYNNYNEYHAWVQVYKSNKWISYDPTTDKDSAFISNNYQILGYY